MYIAIVCLVLLNVFIAIISEGFDYVQDDIKAADRWKETVPSSFSLIREKYVLPFWYKYFHGCFNRMRRKLGQFREPVNSTASTGGTSGAGSISSPLAGSTSVERRKHSSATFNTGGTGSTSNGMTVSETEDINEYQRYIRSSSEFYDQVERCFALAQQRNAVDLFKYFEELYENHRDSDSMYVAIEELSHLIGDSAQVHGTARGTARGTFNTDADAEKLVTTFHALHTMEMLGTPIPHVPPYQRFITHINEAFIVKKINVHGVRQRRWLWVDPASRCLYNFDSAKRLRKRLPLSQLVQVESPQYAPRKLYLVFSSSGISRYYLQDEFRDKLETTYRLEFPLKSQADKFVEIVLSLCETIPRVDDMLLSTQQSNSASEDTARANSEEEENRVDDAGPLRRAPPINPGVKKHRASVVFQQMRMAHRLSTVASRARARVETGKSRQGSSTDGSSTGPTPSKSTKPDAASRVAAARRASRAGNVPGFSGLDMSVPAAIAEDDDGQEEQEAGSDDDFFA